MDIDNNQSLIYFNQRNSNGKEKSNKGMFFTDRCRRIDFVLVYQQLHDKNEKHNKRRSFIQALKDEGLEIEIQNTGGRIISIVDSDCNDENIHGNTSESKNLVFIKIHAPWETLCRYAEIMKIRKPIMNGGVNYNYIFQSFFEKFVNFDFFSLFSIGNMSLKPIAQGYTYPFSNQKSYLFEISDTQSDFFTPVERSLIVNYILKRKGYKSDNTWNTQVWNDANKNSNDVELQEIDPSDGKDLDENNNFDMEDGVSNLNFGIAKLISEKVFESAFILHEPIKSLM